MAGAYPARPRRDGFPGKRLRQGRKEKSLCLLQETKALKALCGTTLLGAENTPTHRESVNSLYANGYIRSDLLVGSADCSEMISQFPILTVLHRTTAL